MNTTQFHLPANTASVRTLHRAQVLLQGKGRRVTFSHYAKRDTFRVAVQSKGWGMLMIGRDAKGTGYVAKHFVKTAHNTWADSGVASKVCTDPKQAFLSIVAQWGDSVQAQAALM